LSIVKDSTHHSLHYYAVKVLNVDILSIVRPPILLFIKPHVSTTIY